jgi:hypothetical protein
MTETTRCSGDACCLTGSLIFACCDAIRFAVLRARLCLHKRGSRGFSKLLQCETATGGRRLLTCDPRPCSLPGNGREDGRRRTYAMPSARDGGQGRATNPRVPAVQLRSEDFTIWSGR